MTVLQRFVVACDGDQCDERKVSTAATPASARLNVDYERRDGRDLCPTCQAAS